MPGPRSKCQIDAVVLIQAVRAGVVFRVPVLADRVVGHSHAVTGLGGDQVGAEVGGALALERAGLAPYEQPLHAVRVRLLHDAVPVGVALGCLRRLPLGAALDRVGVAGECVGGSLRGGVAEHLLHQAAAAGLALRSDGPLVAGHDVDCPGEVGLAAGVQQRPGLRLVVLVHAPPRELGLCRRLRGQEGGCRLPRRSGCWRGRRGRRGGVLGAGLVPGNGDALLHRLVGAAQADDVLARRRLGELAAPVVASASGGQQDDAQGRRAESAPHGLTGPRPRPAVRKGRGLSGRHDHTVARGTCWFYDPRR